MRTGPSRNRTLTSAEPAQLQGGTALRRTCGHITAQSDRNRIGTYLERTAPGDWNSESNSQILIASERKLIQYPGPSKTQKTLQEISVLVLQEEVVGFHLGCEKKMPMYTD